jgi:hypothetical protein
LSRFASLRAGGAGILFEQDWPHFAKCGQDLCKGLGSERTISKSVRKTAPYHPHGAHRAGRVTPMPRQMSDTLSIAARPTMRDRFHAGPETGTGPGDTRSMRERSGPKSGAASLNEHPYASGKTSRGTLDLRPGFSGRGATSCALPIPPNRLKTPWGSSGYRGRAC